MLRQNNLDDENFAVLTERARMSVSKVFSEWNDLNTHDPGVMLIELFAWLTEIQRFHMNQSTDVSAFFPLLGIVPLQERPASSNVTLKAGTTVPVPAGTPIMAEDVRFETAVSIPVNSAPGHSFQVVQKHTLSEDIDCGTKSTRVRPDTYLSQTGERMLFYTQDAIYIRITDRTITPGTARLRLVSSEPGFNFRIGTADGFHERRFVIDARGQHILRDSFTLLIARDETLSSAERWSLTDDFRASGPDDPHFTLNSGVIAFGDGIHGRIPKGVLLVTSMALTHGADGNITSGRLTELNWDGYSLPLEQTQPAEGGAKRESAAEAVARQAAERRQAVTSEDIRALIMETPGVKLEDVTAFSKETVSKPAQPRIAVIAVKPHGERAVLDEAQKRAIRLHIEPYRLAGVEFEIRSAAYVSLQINVEVCAHRQDDGFIQGLESALREYCTTAFAGFRSLISRAVPAGFLAGFSEITRILSCELRTYSRFARMDTQGNILLDPGALAHLDTVRIKVT